MISGAFGRYDPLAWRVRVDIQTDQCARRDLRLHDA